MEDFGCKDFDPTQFKDFASFILTLSPFEFTTLGIIAAYFLTNTLNYAEQNSVGNWLEMVGQIILTMTAQESIKLPPNSKKYCDLVNKVKTLEKELNEIKKK